MYPTSLSHHLTQSGLDWNLSLPLPLSSFLVKLDFHTMYFHNILFPPRASQLSAHTILFLFLTLTISYVSILNLGHFYSIPPSLPPFSLLSNLPFPTSLSLFLMILLRFFFHPQSLIRVAGTNVSGGCLLEHGQLFSCSIMEENDSLHSTRINSSESLSEGHTLCLCGKSSEGSEKGALDWGLYSQGWTFHFKNRKRVLQWQSI